MCGSTSNLRFPIWVHAVGIVRPCFPLFGRSFARFEKVCRGDQTGSGLRRFTPSTCSSRDASVRGVKIPSAEFRRNLKSCCSSVLRIDYSGPIVGHPEAGNCGVRSSSSGFPVTESCKFREIRPRKFGLKKPVLQFTRRVSCICQQEIK